MKRIACVLIAWLALTGLVLAGDVDLPAELKLEPGRLGKLAAESKGEVIRWVNPSTGLDLIPSESGRWVIVSAMKPGAYPVFAYTALGGKPTEAVRCLVIVGVPPEPGPTPPEPGPGPKPNPKPIVKAWVVIVEETAEARDGRGKMVTDKDLHGYLSGKGWKLRMTDKDVVDPQGKTPADLAPYVARAKSKGLPFFCVVDQDGTIRTEGALPDTAAELLDVLKKVGG